MFAVARLPSSWPGQDGLRTPPSPSRPAVGCLNECCILVARAMAAVVVVVVEEGGRCPPVRSPTPPPQNAERAERLPARAADVWGTQPL